MASAITRPVAVRLPNDEADELAQIVAALDGINSPGALARAVLLPAVREYAAKRGVVIARNPT
jgi:hypothetical protein